MNRRAHLHLVAVAASPVAANVIPIGATVAPRERSWRDLVRQLSATTKFNREGKNMDWGVIESRWNEYKGAAKRRWDKLSEDQLSGTRGNRAYLLKRVQEAYALTQEEAEREVANWQNNQVDRLTPAANRP